MGWDRAGVQRLANLRNADVEEPAVGPPDRGSVLIEHRMIGRHGLLGQAVAEFVGDDPDGVLTRCRQWDRRAGLVAGAAKARDDRGVASRLRAAADGDALPAADTG